MHAKTRTAPQRPRNRLAYKVIIFGGETCSKDDDGNESADKGGADDDGCDRQRAAPSCSTLPLD